MLIYEVKELIQARNGKTYAVGEGPYKGRKVSLEASDDVKIGTHVFVENRHGILLVKREDAERAKAEEEAREAEEAAKAEKAVLEEAEKHKNILAAFGKVFLIEVHLHQVNELHLVAKGKAGDLRWLADAILKKTISVRYKNNRIVINWQSYDDQDFYYDAEPDQVLFGLVRVSKWKEIYGN